MEKVILCAGGTGGHIFPALAVAEEIKNKRPGADILFMGSLYGPEGRLAKKAGLEFVGLNVRGLLGRGFKAVPAAARLALAVAKAAKIIRAFKPDVIAAFGGYASAAPALAGRLLGAPVLLHEQNAVAGAGNRTLSRLARTVCVSFPETAGFKRPVVLTGNPARKNIAKAAENRKAFGGRRLLILGGSQGARALNRFVPAAARKLAEAGVEIWHQCGERDEAETRAAYAKEGVENVKITPFIEDMTAAYAWADLAFCRSGASVLAELCLAGLPALLSPFPAAIYDHQTLNARWLEKAGCAVIMPEKELNADLFVAAVKDYFANPAKAESMSRAALALAKPEAAVTICGEMEKIAAKAGGKP